MSHWIRGRLLGLEAEASRVDADQVWIRDQIERVATEIAERVCGSVIEARLKAAGVVEPAVPRLDPLWPVLEGTWVDGDGEVRGFVEAAAVEWERCRITGGCEEGVCMSGIHAGWYLDQAKRGQRKGTGMS